MQTFSEIHTAFISVYWALYSYALKVVSDLSPWPKHIQQAPLSWIDQFFALLLSSCLSMVVAFNVSVSFQQVFVHKKITACKLCRSYWQHVNKCHNQHWLQLDLLDQDNQGIQNEWTKASEPSRSTLAAKPILKCTAATEWQRMLLCSTCNTAFHTTVVAPAFT